MKFIALIAFAAVAFAMDNTLDMEAPPVPVKFAEYTANENKARSKDDDTLANWNKKVIAIRADQLSVSDVMNEVIVKSRKVRFFNKHNVEQKIKYVTAAQPDLKWHSKEDGNIVSCELFKKRAGPDYPNVLPTDKHKAFWIKHRVESCKDGSKVTYHSKNCDKDGAKPCSASVCCTEALSFSKDNSKGAERKRNMLKMLCKLRAEQKYAEILEHWRVKQQNGVLRNKCDSQWTSAQQSFCYEMDRLAAVRDWCANSKKFEEKWTDRSRVTCAEYSAKRKSNKNDLDTIRKEKELIYKLMQKLHQLIAVKPKEAATLMLAEIDAVKSLLSDKNQAMIEESRAHTGYTDKIETLLKDLWRNLNTEETKLQTEEKKMAIMCEYKVYIAHRARTNWALCKNKEKIHVGEEQKSSKNSANHKKFCEDQISVYKSTVGQYKKTFDVFTKETEMIHHLHNNIIGWVKGEQKEYKCKKE